MNLNRRIGKDVMPKWARHLNTDDGKSDPDTGGAGGGGGGGSGGGAPANQNHVLADAAIADIKRKALARGERKAQEALDARAKELGFADSKALFADIADKRKAPVDGQPPAGGGAPTPPAPDAGKALRALQAAQEAAAVEKRNRLNAERQLAVLTVNSQMREAALVAGVKDVDVAVALAHRDVQGMDETGRKAFDPGKYFGEMKEKRPYLFGDVTPPPPANTGAGANNAPPPAPQPGDASKQNANDAKFDARTKTPAEVDARLRELGIPA